MRSETEVNTTDVIGIKRITNTMNNSIPQYLINQMKQTNTLKSQNY